MSNEAYDSGLVVGVSTVLYLVCACKSLIGEAGWVDVAQAGDLGGCERNGGGDVGVFGLRWRFSTRAFERAGAGAGVGRGGAGLVGMVGAGWLICPFFLCLHAAWTDMATNQAAFVTVILAPRRVVVSTCLAQANHCR
jgi:hypothetical protein